MRIAVARPSVEFHPPMLTYDIARTTLPVTNSDLSPLLSSPSRQAWRGAFTDMYAQDFMIVVASGIIVASGVVWLVYLSRHAR
jgi:hypothetical protein